MQANYLNALARVLAYEGGRVNNPKDPGGKTNQGITQSTYNAWLRTTNRPTADVYLISDADRDAIYKSEYWDRIQGDHLPTGLDLAVFDAAVNSGPAQAVKWLQAAVNHPDVRVDGVMGSKTLDAVEDLSGENDDGLIEAYCSRRLATLQRLRTWSTFGKGWHARIANVQKTALSWVTQSPTPMAPDLRGLSGSAKAPIVGNIKPPVISQVAAHMTTAATGAATVASQTASQMQSLSDTFSWVKYAFGVLTLIAIGGGVIAKFSTDAGTAALAGTATATVDLDADANLPGIPDGKPALTTAVAQAKGA